MLTHDRRIVRHWACSAAMKYPHEDYLPALATHMDSEDSIDRYAAAAAIEAIGGPDARRIAKLYLPLERDADVYDTLRETIEKYD
jgi:hypothetical protein